MNDKSDKIVFVSFSTEYFQGCQVVRYNMDERMFDQSLKRNRCRCVRKRTYQQCDGWADFSHCLFGLPIGLSYPHFYNSPTRLKEYVGLKPNRSQHFGHMLVEPQLGIPVQASISLQGMLNVLPIPSVPSLSKLRPGPLPLCWVRIVSVSIVYGLIRIIIKI